MLAARVGAAPPSRIFLPSSLISARRHALTMTRTDEIQSQLFARDPVPPLEPGTKVYDPSLTKDIAGLKDHQYVVAVLHLANDDIEQCHLIAQANEGNQDPTANLLHATLHRREGDYWNSKYPTLFSWYSRVKHPLIPSTSTAKQFVDACEQANGSGDKDEETKLREKQWDELKGMVKWIRENHK